MGTIKKITVPTIFLIIIIIIASSFMQIGLSNQVRTANAMSSSENSLSLLALSSEEMTIANKLQCPICDGQSIIESNSAISLQMRAKVQELSKQGLNEKEILLFFEERYGPIILRQPAYSGISLGVWIVPIVISIFILSTTTLFLIKKNNKFKRSIN